MEHYAGIPIHFFGRWRRGPFWVPIASVPRCPHYSRFAGNVGNADLLASRWT